MTTYIEQSKEIELLCKSITKKAKKFAKQNRNVNYFQDLLHIVCELKELDTNFNPK